MEISRQFKAGFSVQTEAPAQARVERSEQAKAVAGTTGNASESRLEALQDAMRSLPDVDLDKVAAIKQALQRGEIVSDSAALAGSMLAYHSGSDA